MKAVLMSIQPRWCELIALGKKTVEVRKTKPKLEVPFKCYIYCSEKDYDKIFCIDKFMHKVFLNDNGKQKVIGEFTCDRIIDIPHRDLSENFRRLVSEIITPSCLKVEELKGYLGYKDGYGWHISNLIIYDKPRELGEFKKHNRTEDDCKYSHLGYAIPKCEYCHGCQLTRPPQSWCYVEEVNDGT